MRLSTDDVTLIVHALRAVAPSGGGSPQFHLANYIEGEREVIVNNEMVGRLQVLAAGELPPNTLRYLADAAE